MAMFKIPRVRFRELNTVYEHSSFLNHTAHRGMCWRDYRHADLRLQCSYLGRPLPTEC